MTTPTTVNVRLQLRADTAANWTAANPTLLANEVGLETDTKKLKVGNGSSAWNSLAYFPSIVSGGTVLGNLEIGTTGTLTFEGSTADGFETTLAVTNPTADRTITLPNQSGTVVVSGNASIVDADIAANAEIAVSKLADGAARQLLQTDAAGTGVEWTDNVDIPGTLDVTGAATFDGAVTVAGDLTVNGTTTNINTQNLVVEDKNIILGDVATPSDTTADGGGITLKGATDKTINWVDSTDAWTSSEHINIASGKEYRIDGTKVLDATSLGSSVLITSANITDGTIVNGDINASAAIAGTKISPDFGSQTVTTTGVISAAAGAAATPSIAFTGDLNTGIYSPGADQVALATGGTGRLFIKDFGNVGIGTASPAATTHIQTTSQFSSTAGNTSAGLLISQSGGTPADGAYGTAITLSKINSTRPGGAIASVQTTADDDQLGLAFLVHASATTNDTLTEALRISHAGTATFTAASSHAPFIVNIGASEVGRIDSSGKLLLGTSTGGSLITADQTVSRAALSTTAPARIYTGTGTITDNTTAASGTVTHGTIVAFDNPAIAASNLTVTYTNASTVYIDGAPTAGTNVTVTNPYALYVNAGTSFFGGNVNLSTGNEYRINNTKVVGARVTGWTAATGTATRTTFATSTVTTAQLAERVKALIDDLISHGLIGT